MAQKNLQVDVPLVSTVERLTVHVRPGSQQILAMVLMGKRCFQMVVCSSAENRDLHTCLALGVLQKPKLW